MDRIPTLGVHQMYFIERLALFTREEKEQFFQALDTIDKLLIFKMGLANDEVIAMWHILKQDLEQPSVPSG